MKKNNDGYVLPFVLVVMIVLCIISTTLMTSALRNLQSQQKFTARMVDKYEAEGEIEKIVAVLSREEHFKDFEYQFTYTPDPSETATDPWPWPTEDEIKTSVKNKVITLVDENLIECDEAAITVTGDKDEKFVSCILKVRSSTENPIITAELEMTGTIKREPRKNETIPSVPSTQKKNTFSVADLKLTYQSYEISTKEVAEE